MLKIFFDEFWPVTVVTAIVFPLLSLGRILSLDGNATFVGARQFPELKPFAAAERKRILHRADRAAFPGLRSVIPALTYSVLFSGIAAACQTLRVVGMLPDSLGMTLGVGFTALFGGGWLIGRLEAYRIRPFLALEIRRRPDGRPAI